MIELTDEIILKIDDLLDDWAFPAVEIGLAACDKKEIPKKYINDDILVEYYNGIKASKGAHIMRKICLPKYIRRGLNKI